MFSNANPFHYMQSNGRLNDSANDSRLNNSRLNISHLPKTKKPLTQPATRRPAVNSPQHQVNTCAVVNGWTGGEGVELQRVVNIYIHIQPLKKITHSRSP